MVLCERVFPEETFFLTPELEFSSGTVGHSEFAVGFVVYSKFEESKY